MMIVHWKGTKYVRGDGKIAIICNDSLDDLMACSYISSHSGALEWVERKVDGTLRTLAKVVELLYKKDVVSLEEVARLLDKDPSDVLAMDENWNYVSK